MEKKEKKALNDNNKNSVNKMTFYRRAYATIARVNARTYVQSTMRIYAFLLFSKGHSVIIRMEAKTIRRKKNASKCVDRTAILANLNRKRRTRAFV